MRKGPQKFLFSFEAEAMTRFGGLSIFRQFCKSLALRHFLQLYVRWPDYEGRDFHPADLFLAHLFTIVAGLGRVENTQCLIHNGLVPLLLGLPRFPHRDTLRTFLHRFRPEHLRSLGVAHGRVRAEFFRRLGLLYSAVVDADTTTLTVFGHQELVEVGYNRKYRGKRSYAPILSSEGHSGLSLGFELRSGNVHSTTGAWQFLKPQLNKIPSTVAASRTRARLDGGFYDKDLMRRLDGERIGYLIVARMTPSLKKRMIAARYHEFADGWEAAEFTYPLTGFQKEHRFVAIRRPVAKEPEDLLSHFYTFKRYAYHRAFAVGRLDLSPEACYRFYTDRAAQELLIREFKDAYGMAEIPTRSFHANAAYMEIILWAYDLVRAFQFLCLPEERRHWNISTLRRELWWLPAEWIKRGNRNTLRLPALYPDQEMFFRILKAAQRAKPLF
jgi:hypothetical protein